MQGQAIDANFEALRAVHALMEVFMVDRDIPKSGTEEANAKRHKLAARVRLLEVDVESRHRKLCVVVSTVKSWKGNIVTSRAQASTAEICAREASSEVKELWVLVENLPQALTGERVQVADLFGAVLFWFHAIVATSLAKCEMGVVEMIENMLWF